MSERKPPGMKTGSWIEQQIADAMAQGAFDNLPGAGKPLANSGKGYDPDEWLRAKIEREGASYTPPALELRRKTERELAALGTMKDEATVRARFTALNAEIAKFNATTIDGPPTNLAPLNVEQVVLRWRSTRSG